MGGDCICLDAPGHEYHAYGQICCRTSLTVAMTVNIYVCACTFVNAQKLTCVGKHCLVRPESYASSTTDSLFGAVRVSMT